MRGELSATPRRLGLLTRSFLIFSSCVSFFGLSNRYLVLYRLRCAFRRFRGFIFRLPVGILYFLFGVLVAAGESLYAVPRRYERYSSSGTSFGTAVPFCGQNAWNLIG